MSVGEMARQGFRHYGLVGALQRVAHQVPGYLREVPLVSERHVWYALDLAAQRPQYALPAGFECTRAAGADLHCLRGLDAPGLVEAGMRLAAGAELWLVRDGTQVASVFWLFHHSTPVRAAHGGWLALPPDVACLEDVVTADNYRGRGLGSAAWTQVADSELQRGVQTLVTKVREENQPARHAMERAGFKSIARMSFRRVWLIPAVHVAADAGAERCQFLLQQLNR